MYFIWNYNIIIFAYKPLKINTPVLYNKSGFYKKQRNNYTVSNCR